MSIDELLDERIVQGIDAGLPRWEASMVGGASVCMDTIGPNELFRTLCTLMATGCAEIDTAGCYAPSWQPAVRR